ncbi:MAG: DUF4838 domain-containing protein [candidate division WS1 bacterium]|jgi:hypothetical protein|nr:DUF4838 domain-containing protein [candidate division WS1 bacterium]
MKLILSPDNQPAASVVIEANSPPAVSFAARELSRYLAILTGARFPVREGESEGLQIRLVPHPLGPTATAGPSPVARLRELLPPPPALRCAKWGGRGGGRLCGAYAWRVHEGGVEIVGERPGSLLHGVYALLETLGCRWLHPRDGGEIIPRIPRIELALGEHIAEPAMTHRELTNLYAIDREYPLHIDWMAKNRLSRFMAFLNMPGSLEAYRDLIEPELSLRDMDATLGHHSFRFLLPPEEHFAEHPEWYALIGGARSPDGQLCTSNPEVVERVAERICALFGEFPAVEMFGLWPNDGFGWCECEECARIEEQRPSQFRPEQPRRTETYLRFVNSVAERVAEEHPDRRLSALVYVNYADAPENVRPAENVAICFAAFQRCLKHPLGPDVECDRGNAAYAREFQRWREITPGDLYVFSYLTQIHTLSLPYPIHEMIAQNQRWLVDAGCDGFTAEFVPEEWGAFGANLYLMARLAWQPELDVEAWLGGHDELIFGPAAESIGEYRHELREVLIHGGPCTGHYDLDWTRRATERLLAPALEAFGHARALAATGERRHWEALQQQWVGLELLLRTATWRRLLAEIDRAPEVRLESLRARAEAAHHDLLSFARAHADSGAVDVKRYERISGD